MHTCLYPGISQLLTKLNKQKVPWGIVTNKPESITHKLVPYFDELDKCQAIVGGDTLSERKPHPAPLLYACKQMSVSPEQCLYIGDALRDIEAGNSANMYSIIALWGYIADKAHCAQWQANSQVNLPEEIIQFIL